MKRVIDKKRFFKEFAEQVGYDEYLIFVACQWCVLYGGGKTAVWTYSIAKVVQESRIIENY